MEYTRNQQLALLLALYGVALSSMGERNDSAKQAVLNPDLKVFFDDILNLRDSLVRVSRGKNIELYPIGLGLKQFINLESRNPSIQPKVVELIKAFGLYFRAGSTQAWKKIDFASASPIFPEWVRSSFKRRVGDQSQVKQALEQSMQALTGKKGLLGFEDLNDAAEAKRKKPELYKEYLKLRKQFNDIWKNELSNFVRASGKHTVPMQDFLKHLKARNMGSSIPEGFTGNVDANGVWYDSEDRRLNGAPTAAVFPSVKMNPNPEPGAWVFQGIRTDGSPGGHFYAVDDVRKRKSQKFENVKELASKINGIRKRWLVGISHFSEEHKETVAAAVLELTYQFSARIGTLGNSAGGKSTYGLSTLLVKHVHNLDDKGFVLKYLGKDGVPFRHKYAAQDVVSKKIVEGMNLLVAGKKPNDPLFTYLQGETRKPVLPALVNKVFHVLGAPAGVTVHKLRTLKGTAIFNEEFEKLKNRKVDISTPNAAMTKLKEIATKVGKELNHVRRGIDGGIKATGATALAAYIDLEAQVAFFEYYGLPLPAYLLKMTGKGELSSTQPIEAAEGDSEATEDTPAKEESEEAPAKGEGKEGEDKPKEDKTKEEKPNPEEDDDDAEYDPGVEAEELGISPQLLEHILTSPDSTVEELFDLPDTLF